MSLLNKIFPEVLPTPAREQELFSIKRISAFIISLIQLLALFFIIRQFGIEKTSGITVIAPIVLTAFTLSSFLPLRFRPAILFFTCVAVIYYAFGIFSGTVLILGGLGLILCCHLPVRFWIRVALILIAGCGMIILRADLFYAPRAVVIVPFLASMFMFRMIIYLYEIKHNQTPATFWQRLSYFFLFPNLCFLLFPIIDYKTYLKTYYQRADEEIWQKGIRWILRGTVHLICYRFVYTNLLTGPEQVNDLLSLLKYITVSYALILRLSGLLHLAVGILVMFGLDLHPIFNNYLLSTGFVDMWRRINIYWREFIMKIFFYPLMFKLKKKISSNLLPATMIIVFVVTWFMHNYQWFWVRGFFPLTPMDMIFWGVIGICITLEAMWIEKNQEKPKKHLPEKYRYPLAITKMIGVFLFMSVMWALWGSGSVEEWKYLLMKGTHTSGKQIALIACVIAGIIVAGSFIYKLTTIPPVKKLLDIPAHQTLTLTLPAIAILATIALPQVKNNLPAGIRQTIAEISGESINANEQKANERGYYKALIDGDDSSERGLWEVNLKRPNKFSGLDKIYIRTTGLLPRVYRPSTKVTAGGYTLETDSLGLRDKEYSVRKPPSTFRIALLGGSYEAGAGVNNEEIFECLTEEKLNKENTDSIYKHFEIMNFAEPGYHLVQHVELIHTKIFRYQPDAVLYVAHSGEDWRLQGFISDLVKTGADLQYPFLKEIKKLSGVKQTMSDIEIKERLAPYVDNIIQWSYVQIVSGCRKNGVTPVWCYLPTTADAPENKEYLKIKAYAQKLGFVVMDLKDVYGDIDRKSIAVSETDSHPNAKGHRIIFEGFYKEFIKNKELIMRPKK